jgi:Tfp pilus assembly protein PilN
MRLVNLLPSKARRAREPSRRPRLGLVCGGLIVVAWIAAALGRARQIGIEASGLQQSARSFADHAARTVALAKQLNSLRERRAPNRHPAPKVPVSASLSLISELVPEGIVLSELEVRSTSAVGTAVSGTIRTVRPLHLKVTGLATSDAALVALVKGLTNSAFLRDVRADQQTFGDGGLPERTRFSISMEMGPPATSIHEPGGCP